MFCVCVLELEDGAFFFKFQPECLFYKTNLVDVMKSFIGKYHSGLIHFYQMGYTVDTMLFSSSKLPAFLV